MTTDKKFWTKVVEVMAGQKKFTTEGDEGLDIEFEIPFSDNKDPDVAEIIIYNLSDSSIEAIKRDGYIFVNAGYKEMNNTANIFTGLVERVDTKWVGVDKMTSIKATDGAEAWRKTKIKRTYPNGAKASDIMRDIAGIMGYEIVEISPKEDKVYKLGRTVTGYASDALWELANETKSKLFINKNRITIRDQEKGNDSGILLNETSGLIGRPTELKDDSGDKSDYIDYDEEKKKSDEAKKSWQVEALMDARLEPDAIIKIESKALSGMFRIVKGVYNRDFNVEMEVVEA